jgi:hypothetical protein
MGKKPRVLSGIFASSLSPVSKADPVFCVCWAPPNGPKYTLQGGLYLG